MSRLIPEEVAAIRAEAINLFGCDEARIASPMGRHFLVIGHMRNTRNTPGQWYRNGTPIDFDFVEEHVIASGATAEELRTSMRDYRALTLIGKP